MIAMQYGFVLPADYDMAIIERRIRGRGSMTDGFPHLRFKAYLSARRDEGSADNLYAPFYLWEAAAGLNAFVTGPGFAALARDFGRPAVRTWMVLHAELGPALEMARFATRTEMPIAPGADLAAMRDDAVAAARDAVAEGAIAAVAGFDPGPWSRVDFRLWAAGPSAVEPGTKAYRVGHLSLAAPAEA